MATGGNAEARRDVCRGWWGEKGRGVWACCGVICQSKGVAAVLVEVDLNTAALQFVV